MTIDLASVSEANIRASIEYPPLVMRVLAPDDRPAFAKTHERYFKAVRSQMSFIGRLLDSTKMQPPEVVQLPDPMDKNTYLRLNSSPWLLHLLLTGSEDLGDYPLNFLMCNSAAIHYLDVGYGGVAVFKARVVQEIYEALTHLSETELRNRYPPDEPEQLEAADLDSDLIDASASDELPESTVDESLEGSLKAIAELRVFLREAAEQGRGMVMY